MGDLFDLARMPSGKPVLRKRLESGPEAGQELPLYVWIELVCRSDMSTVEVIYLRQRGSVALTLLDTPEAASPAAISSTFHMTASVERLQVPRCIQSWPRRRDLTSSTQAYALFWRRRGAIASMPEMSAPGCLAAHTLLSRSSSPLAYAAPPLLDHPCPASCPRRSHQAV